MIKHNYLTNNYYVNNSIGVFSLKDALQKVKIDYQVQLASGRWFSPNTPVSSTNKTDRHNITEILLKVALNTITLTSILSLLSSVMQIVVCPFVLFLFVIALYGLRFTDSDYLPLVSPSISYHRHHIYKIRITTSQWILLRQPRRKVNYLLAR